MKRGVAIGFLLVLLVAAARVANVPAFDPSGDAGKVLCVASGTLGWCVGGTGGGGTGPTGPTGAPGATGAQGATGATGPIDTVVAKTADYSISSADNGTTFSNRGAAGNVIFTLPTAATGLRYRFAVDTAQPVLINNASGDVISFDGTVLDASGINFLTCNSATGSTLELLAPDADSWFVTRNAGKWEFDNGFSSVEFHRKLPPYEIYLDPNVGYVPQIQAGGELAWVAMTGGVTGSFVHISGDTMTGKLTAASGITVATGSTIVKDLTCNSTADMYSNLYMHGGALNFRGAQSQNIINLPTGETEGLIINDVGGQWYGHMDTQNKTFNFDVVSGYSSAVYFNQGNLYFNGSHLNNMIVIPTGDTDALDVKDAAGNFLIVMNTSTLGFAIHGSNTNDGAGAGYIGEHLQDFVSSASGPTGTPSPTGSLIKTVVSHTVTAGDWMVRGTVCAHQTSATSAGTFLIAAISDTTNSLGSSVIGLTQAHSVGASVSQAVSNIPFDHCTSVGPARVSLSGSTTEYLVAKWSSSTSSIPYQIYGGWEWWRVR